MQTQSPKMIMAPDIVFMDAADVFPADAGPGDMVIDRPKQRLQSKLICPATSALLGQFSQPISIPEAIVRYARDTGGDATDLLEVAFPVLQSLVDDRFLLPADAELPVEPQARLAVGQTIAGYRILRTVRITDDTEVHLAEGDSGLASLKTLTVGQHAAAFQDEIVIAKRLSGKPGPMVRDVAITDDIPVLISDWISSVDAETYAQSLRNGSRQALLRFLVRIVRAFADIHGAGLVHGDIRANNILVDRSGAVHVIDFGLSSAEGDLKRCFEFSVMEPEAAADFRVERGHAQTMSGEQFALAALLYMLASGKEPREIPAMRTEALAHLSTASFRSFAEQGVTPWPALEQVLHKAAALDPSARFADLTEFATALDAIAAPATVADTAIPDISNADLCNIALDRADLHGGMLGPAWVAYRRAVLTGDAEAMRAADHILRKLDRSDFRDIPFGSPLHDYRGLLILRARVAYLRHDVAAARTVLDELTALICTPCEKTELFGGSAGMLAALAAFVEDYQIYDARIDALRQPLATLLETHVGAVRSLLVDMSAGRAAHLGMAHGLVGLTYACLRAATVLECPIDPAVTDVLAVLQSQAVPMGRGVAWPGTLNAGADDPVTVDFAPGWCSGTAGYVYLWLAAYCATGLDEYLQLAERAGYYTADHPGTESNICCGLAGRALSLCHLTAYSSTENWSKNAQSLTKHSVRNRLTFDAPDGALFRGYLGSIYALQEGCSPNGATRFPMV